MSHEGQKGVLSSLLIFQHCNKVTQFPPNVHKVKETISHISPSQELLLPDIDLLIPPNDITEGFGE